MSEFNDNYVEIIEELQKNITNKEDLEFAVSKINELSISYMKNIENMHREYSDKIKSLEEEQAKLENTVINLQESISNIKNDIYEECYDDYEFEVVCPYCNSVFTSDADIETDKEIKCPECNNIIELEWNDESNNNGCTGSCSMCGKCGSINDENDEEYKGLFNNIEIDTDEDM